MALDDQGTLRATMTIFPHEAKRQAEAAATIRSLVAAHRPAAIAVGNGTAGRETADFLETLALGIPVVLVFVIGLAFGAALGLVNGVLVAFGKVPALVITLGTLALDRVLRLQRVQRLSVRGQWLVMVSGEWVIRDGAVTGKRPGKALQGPGYRAAR